MTKPKLTKIKPSVKRKKVIKPPVDKSFALSLNTIFKQMEKEPDLLKRGKDYKRKFTDEIGHYTETDQRFDKKGMATDGSGIEVIGE